MPRGGERPGSGPKPIGGATGRNYTVRLPPEVEAELADGLQGDETLADVLRDGGLMLVRARDASKEQR